MDYMTLKEGAEK